MRYRGTRVADMLLARLRSSSLAATGNPVYTNARGVCLVSGLLGMCTPRDPCGASDGVLTYTRLHGTFTDGYEQYPEFVSCRFHIDPELEAAIRPLASLKVTPVMVQLGYVAGATCPSARASHSSVVPGRRRARQLPVPRPSPSPSTTAGWRRTQSWCASTRQQTWQWGRLRTRHRGYMPPCRLTACRT